jgi:hypothetical protein
VEATQRVAGVGRRAGWTIGLLAGLALLAQVAAVFRTNVHWDEFAQLHLADMTLASGTFESGGRPGLATLLLLPFVAGCDDEIAVVRRARLLWVLFTAAFLAGVWVWTAQLGGGWRDAALAVALLALVPAFLDASVQVRTDQIALAGGAWGGAALLASRRRPALALAAGLAFGVGMLGSQKLVYVGALAGLLAAGELWLARELRPGREALRVLLCAAAGAAVLVGFALAVRLAFRLPEVSPSQAPIDAAAVSGGLSLFEFYRRTIGWRQYAQMLPSLGAHGVLLGALALASLRVAGERRRRLALAWAVLALGLAVGLFHAAAFAYFWMTLGLFPALALALAREPVLHAAVPRAPRTRSLALAGFALLLALPASLGLAARWIDAQRVQRESLRFVHRNFERAAAGFQPERALFCQEGAQPGLTWFSQQIYRQFGRDPAERDHHARRLVDEFRSTPVLFLVQSFRLDQFPAEVRRFWFENYQPYRASVFVAGRRLSGARGQRSEFELVAPGRYRWLPLAAPRSVAIDGRVLRPGEVLAFAPGRHEASFVEDVEGGLLVLALKEPPGEAPLRFYR